MRLALALACLLTCAVQARPAPQNFMAGVANYVQPANIRELVSKTASGTSTFLRTFVNLANTYVDRHFNLKPEAKGEWNVLRASSGLKRKKFLNYSPSKPKKIPNRSIQ